MEEARNDSRVAVGESQKARTTIFWKHKETKKNTLCYTDGHMSPQECELEPKLQMYEGRIVLQEYVVKDDSGVYVVFTEQDSTASQMTAAKVMDVIPSLPDCDGQAADAISAHTQVKMEDTPKLLRIPKSECPDIWISFPRHKWPKSWANIEDPVIPLEQNLYGHPLVDLLWQRQFEEIEMERGWEEKSTECGMPVCSSKTKIILTGKCEWCQKDWKEAEYDSHVEEIDEQCWHLTNQLHFLITYFWDALNVNVTQSKLLLRTTEKCSDHVFLQEELKNNQDGKNLTQKRLRGPTTWKDMLKKCVERYCELTKKKKDRAVIQSLESLRGWSPFHEDRTSRHTRIFLSLVVWRTPEHILIMLTCAWLKLTCDVKSCVLSRCASKNFPFHSMFHKTLLTFTDYTHFTTADWDQQYLLCYFAWRKTVWLPGWNTSSHISRRRNLNLQENCQKYPHNFSWNDCTWHRVVGLTFFGQWTNLLDQSSNGQELVTDVSSFDFIHSSRKSQPTIWSWHCRWWKHGTAL